LDEAKFETALASLKQLFGRESLEGCRFLDIGCGSGIFSIAAKRLGAREVVGIDVNPRSVEASAQNARSFGLKSGEALFIEADILDAATVRGLGKFDLVYAWGSLHHTGRMWDAIAAASGLVEKGGCLAIGIYKKHFTSLFWKVIKRFYNESGSWMRKALICFFYPLILVSVLVLAGKNPFRMRRGMDFYHDVVDWVGGFPYEFASRQEVVDCLEKKGFSLERFSRRSICSGTTNSFL
jgi:2-polyprenyl-6-hydroxyphenyl methylase/3-demethylubiquinone-9 3-methyltransferase